MFNSLKNFFQQSEKTYQNIESDLQLLSGLMIEAASIDGHIDQQEVNKISKVLIDGKVVDASHILNSIKIRLG